MAAQKKQKGILVLSKEKIDCYVTGSPAVLSLSFPINIIRSMEVIDRTALQTLVKTFLETNKVPLAEYSLIVHSNILFEKCITPAVAPVTPVQQVAPAGAAQPATPSQPQPVTPAAVSPEGLKSEKDSKSTHKQLVDDEEEKIAHFVETVPFDEVLMKTGKLPQGKTVFVVNKLLVTPIKEAFEQLGSVVDAVYPATIFGKEAQLETGLTIAGAGVLLTKVDTLRSMNMLIAEKPVEIQTGPVAMGMPQKESDKKRLYLMIGVFVILIGLMVFAFNYMNAENAKLDAENAAARQARLQAKPKILPTPIPTVIVVASTSAEQKNAIPLQLTITPGKASLSGQLRQQLEDLGYQVTVKSERRVTGTPQIIFTQNIPEDVKTELYTTVLIYDETTSVLENTEELPGVVISF